MSKKRPNNYLIGIDPGVFQQLGRLVAEEDKNLADYYVHAERYVNRALSFEDPAVFFVGSKGSGKSAILQMVRLIRSADEHRLINISPDDLAFSALAKIKADTPLLANAGQNQFIFKSLWDYVLSLEVLKREFPGKSAFVETVLGLFRGRQRADANRLLNISISDDGAVHTLSERILQLVREVEISGEAQGLKLSGKVHLEATEKNDQLTLLALVNSVAKNLPHLIKHQYYILIDDLDIHWNDTPPQNAFLASLFVSLRKLNCERLKFCVALRERIYKSLPLDDKDKFRDWVCNVQWDMGSVRDMLEKRLSVAIEIRPDEVWGSLFPANAMDALWRRTTGKPRELIRLAKICLETAFSHGHGSVEDGDIGLAVTKFSEEKIEDLVSELTYAYRGLDKLIKKMIGWQKQFPLERIQELAYEISYECEPGKSSRPAYDWAGVYADDSKGLVKILLETGILRLKQSRTARPEEYDPEHPIELNAEMWFEIHPMLAPGLKCVGD